MSTELPFEAYVSKYPTVKAQREAFAKGDIIEVQSAIKAE